MHYGMMKSLRLAILGLVGLLASAYALRLAPAAEKDETVVESLLAVLGKNIGHARGWLDQADFKSLNQSAGGLQLLAALLKARSDDAAWQSACDKIEASVSEVQSAAKGEDKAKCQAALANLEKSAAAVASLKPSGQPQTQPRAPAIRPLMLVMDGIYADGKIALLSGNIEAAKKQAFVLAELGGLVSNSRTDERWLALAGEFTKAASTAATSSETDPQAVRQLLRGISQRCEACHETRTR